MELLQPVFDCALEGEEEAMLCMFTNMNAVGMHQRSTNQTAIMMVEQTIISIAHQLLQTAIKTGCKRLEIGRDVVWATWKSYYR